MTNVVIAGIGQTKIGEHWEISLRELAFYAMEAAQKDSGGLQPQALFVGNLFGPTLSRQAHLGALLADFAGMRGIEAATIEAAGASGGAAIRAGYLAVKSGMVDAAMVVGVEKVTDQVGPEVDAAIAATIDSDYEAVHGVTPTMQAALLMQRYLFEYDVARNDFAAFPLISHANGANNPQAMYQRAIKASVYERAGLVSTPLNMFDIAPDADGAAALILTRPELLPASLEIPHVQIIGSSVATDTLSLHDRPNPLDFRAVRLSVERAAYQAGILPDQIDFFELDDAFSIYAALVLEAAGFTEHGRSVQQAKEGRFNLDGALPINTMGGAKARGNPWGATGIYQAVETVIQLRGMAGANQIPEAKRAMIQCMGGPASTVVSHILQKVGV